MNAVATRCPCLSGLTYDVCCRRFHQHDALPVTAEQLMRSRFSAFALGDPDYLLDSWHPLTRPDELALDPDVRWYRLDVQRTARGGPLDDEGVVEFAASFRHRDGAGVLHERSRFVRDAGRWFYVDAITD